MIKGLFFAIVIFLVGTFPATWLLMLFLGNVHANVSYWARCPWARWCRSHSAR